MVGTSEKNEESVSRVINPLVFISHDTRDAELAEAFSNLLKSVSAGVLKSFRTSDRRGNQGIEYGVEWYPEIIKNIQGASDVVCLLTQRSVNRPWILFEAGMAKGKLDTPILGVALGIELKDASTGPFAQFQNCGDDEESLTKLVFQLVDRIPNSEPDQDTIKFQVGKFKKSIEVIFQGLASKEAQSSVANPKKQIHDIENSSAKLFEEIKIMFQDLPSRIERSSPIETRRRKRKIHPGMIEEMVLISKNSRLGIRMALSLYRDRLSWIYDEGTALLLKIDSLKTQVAREKIVHDFDELFMLGTRGVFAEQIFMDDKEDFILFNELPRIIVKSVERLVFQETF